MLEIINQKKIIFLSAVVSSFIIIGGTFPYGFPLFTPAVLIYFAIYFLKFNKIRIYKNLFPFIILLLFYVFPLGILGTVYPHNIDDTINAISVLIFFIILQNVLINETQFRQYTIYLQKVTFVAAFVVALIGLYKFFLLLQGTKLTMFYRSDGRYPWGTSLVGDYNIFGLCLIIGLISGYFISKRKMSLTLYIFVNLMALTIIVALLLTASRRAWIALSGLLLVIITPGLSTLVKNCFYFLKTFQIKRKQSIKILALGATILAIIFVISEIFPEGFSIKHRYHLTRMKTRLLTLKNITATQSQAHSRSKIYDYAFQMINEHSLLQLLIGNGSNYLPKFGQYFEGSGYGYPHNPILSAILQSGLIGTMIAFGYICYSFFLYITCLKFEETKYYLLQALVASFYYYISGNSIFSSKLYVFLALLMPLLNSHISKKMGHRQIKNCMQKEV
jgi:O-antigen ligase